jgi:hypothetical protein
MEKNIVLLVSFLTLLSLIPSVSAVGADFYVVDIAPKHVVPGETTLMNITLKNLGSGYAAYLRAILDPNDVSPVSAVGEMKKYLSKAEAAAQSDQYFGIVRQRDEMILQYVIQVDDDASTGTYYVPLALIWENEVREEKNQTLNLGITVTGTPNLIVAGVNTTPSRIYVDLEFTLSIQIENIGTEKAEAVEAKLVLPREFSGERTAFLGTIKRDAISTATYDLKATKQATNKAYDFALLISYTDEKGEENLAEKHFDVYVSKRGEIDLEIAGISTSPTKLYPGSDFTLSIQLENIGTQDAKSVKVELSPRKEFIGEYSSFIGKIEEDDVSSGIFDMRIAKDAEPKTYDIAMKIIYTDERGTEYVDEKQFPIFVDKVPKKYPKYLAAFGIVITILAIYIRRRKMVTV